MPKFMEYGCGKCGAEVEVFGEKHPRKCYDCGSTLLIRRINGPLYTKRQVDNLRHDVSCLWDETERFDETLKEILKAMRAVATEVENLKTQLHAFIEVHSGEQIDETKH